MKRDPRQIYVIIVTTLGFAGAIVGGGGLAAYQHAHGTAWMPKAEGAPVTSETLQPAIAVPVSVPEPVVQPSPRSSDTRRWPARGYQRRRGTF